MDRVSNTDRLVRLLRQELAKRTQSKKTAKKPEGQPLRESGLDQVRAVAGRVAAAGGEEKQLRRILVEQLLADQFGAGLVNEPRFQQIVDQVADLMVEDLAVAGLMEQATRALRRNDL